LSALSGLIVAALVALLLTCLRRPVAAADFSEIRLLTALTVVAQSGHFIEEYRAGFQLSFPQLFGLAAWTDSFFVAFNLAWIILWTLAIVLLPRWPGVAVFPVWFLAIAAMLNGLVHPLLAINAGGYFPGLWSSPVIAVLGFLLLRKLAVATR
jgi:hypothetical protein